jgi:SAM-dependent methyltransferase
VIAVEPDARMRSVLSQRVPTAQVREGRGEALPLEDASVDAFVGASCWHWVEQTQGFAEAARVLRENGQMGLLWTGPDRSQDWVAQLMAGGGVLDEEKRRQSDHERRIRHRPELPSDAPFSAPEVEVFRFTKPSSAEDLMGLCGTYSVAIVLDPTERQSFLDKVADYARNELGLGEDGTIDLPVGCIAWRTTRLA